jgi:hypothetical protein
MLGRTRKDVWSDARFKRHVELMERLIDRQRRQHSVTVNDELINKQQRQHGVTVNDVDERTRRLTEKCDDKDANKSCDVDMRLIEESYQTCDAESIKCRLENRKSVGLVVDPKRDVIVADVSDSSDAHPLRHAAMNAIDAVAHAQVLIDNLV